MGYRPILYGATTPPGYPSRLRPPTEAEGRSGGTLCCMGTVLQVTPCCEERFTIRLTSMGRPKSNEKLVPVMVRLASAEVEKIDARRGGRSRSDYVRSMLFPAPLSAQTPKAEPKRHADDCSCLSCKAPKAVAK